MSAAFKQAIQNIDELSINEKALMAHCLISSLESKQDDQVDDAWIKLAESRYLEMKSGSVDGLSWDAVKEIVKN